jgi:hypothetical protein
LLRIRQPLDRRAHVFSPRTVWSARWRPFVISSSADAPRDPRTFR